MIHIIIMATDHIRVHHQPCLAERRAERSNSEFSSVKLFLGTVAVPPKPGNSGGSVKPGQVENLRKPHGMTWLSAFQCTISGSFMSLVGGNTGNDVLAALCCSYLVNGGELGATWWLCFVILLGLCLLALYMLPTLPALGGDFLFCRYQLSKWD